jgi:hypothetical protein
MAKSPLDQIELRAEIARLQSERDAMRVALERIADLECRHAAAFINKDCGPCIADQALADI